MRNKNLSSSVRIFVRILVYGIIVILIAINIMLYDAFSVRIFTKELYFKKLDTYLFLNILYYYHDNPTMISTYKKDEMKVDSLRDINWYDPFNVSYAMTDSSLILFVQESVKIPDGFDSKVMIEQVIYEEQDTVEAKKILNRYSGLEIHRVCNDFWEGTDTWFKRFKDIHN